MYIRNLICLGLEELSFELNRFVSIFIKGSCDDNNLEIEQTMIMVFVVNSSLVTQGLNGDIILEILIGLIYLFVVLFASGALIPPDLMWCSLSWTASWCKY